MRQRFPSLKDLKYFNGEQPVADLADVIVNLRKQGVNSLKLTAKVERSAIQEASKESSSYEIQHLGDESSTIVKDSSIMEISDVLGEEKLELPA
jgi:hypothetical protein